MEIKLTQYSHGAGCGCKIAPNVLEQILANQLAQPDDKNLLVGNHSKDDAAVYSLGNGRALISTTDFFMPIVDDPYDFGRIASANAISDVYAMGGNPILAIAILGWPLDKLSPEIAGKVIAGSRSICNEAGITLAGGHSIDAPEPIFGLAVNGLVDLKNLKQNNTAKQGDKLYLTKPLGVGILTTAEKKGNLKEEHIGLAARQMMRLNKIGALLGAIAGVNAMTDVTGFGLLGHLSEVAEGSGLSAVINFENVKWTIPDLANYIEKGAVPGGTIRNLKAYGHKIYFLNGNQSDLQSKILADPQTSGGLLISVDESHCEEVENLFVAQGLKDHLVPIGFMKERSDYAITVI